MKKRRTVALVVIVALVALMGVTVAPWSARAADNESAQVEVVSGGSTSTVTGLTSAIANAESGSTIRLTEDVDLGTLENPESDTGLISISGKELTLDLAGHTISGSLVTNGTTYARAHIILIQDGGTLHVTDSASGGEIVNANPSSNACTRAVKVVAGGTLTMDGGTITATSGVGLLNLGTTTLSGSAGVRSLQTGYTGGWDNGVAGIENREGGRLSISGGTYSSASQAALFCDSSAGTVEISGGTFSGVVPYGVINGTGSESAISISGGTFSTDVSAYVADGCVMTEQDGLFTVGTVSEPTSGEVTSSDQFASLLADADPLQPQNLTLGADVTVSSNLTLPSTWSLSIPAGRTLSVADGAVFTAAGRVSGEGSITVSGNGFVSGVSNVDAVLLAGTTPQVSNGVVSVSTPMQLQMLRALLAADGQSGITQIRIDSDIAIPNGAVFEMLGIAVNAEIDGQGHAISGLTMNSSSDDLGLFQYLDGCHIHDLSLEGVDLTTNTGYVGALACGVWSSTIENVSVSGSVAATGTSYGVAAIAGSAGNEAAGSRCDFINCSSSARVGGPYAYNVGSMYGTSTGSLGTIGIYNCSNSGAITAQGSMGYVFGFGFVGNNIDPDAQIQIIAFANTGTVNGEAGSISTAQGATGTVDAEYVDSSQYRAVQVAGSDGSTSWTAVGVSNEVTTPNEDVAIVDETAQAAATGAVNAAFDQIAAGETPTSVSAKDAAAIHELIASASESGQKISVSTTVVVKQDAVASEGDNSLIDAELSEDEQVLQSFDIAVEMTVSTSDGTGSVTARVTELDEPMTVTLKGVSGLRGATGIVRVARVHNGEVQFLAPSELSVDRDGGTITITADRFSTYAVTMATGITVSYESNGGPSVGSQTYALGETISAPAAPARDGYDFDGWYADAELTTPYEFGTAVADGASDLTLYAKWTQLHTVTFDDCLDSTGNDSVTVRDGETVARPQTDPTLDGWRFLGWYEYADGAYADEPYDFATPVTEDLTLYAKWEKVGGGSAEQGGSGEQPTTPSEGEASTGSETEGNMPATGDVTSFAPAVAAAVAGVSVIAGAVALRRRQK